MKSTFRDRVERGATDRARVELVTFSRTRAKCAEFVRVRSPQPTFFRRSEPAFERYRTVSGRCTFRICDIEREVVYSRPAPDLVGRSWGIRPQTSTILHKRNAHLTPEVLGRRSPPSRGRDAFARPRSLDRSARRAQSCSRRRRRTRPPHARLSHRLPSRPRPRALPRRDRALRGGRGRHSGRGGPRGGAAALPRCPGSCLRRAAGIGRPAREARGSARARAARAARAARERALADFRRSARISVSIRQFRGRIVQCARARGIDCGRAQHAARADRSCSPPPPGSARLTLRARS